MLLQISNLIFAYRHKMCKNIFTISINQNFSKVKKKEVISLWFKLHSHFINIIIVGIRDNCRMIFIPIGILVYLGEFEVVEFHFLYTSIFSKVNITWTYMCIKLYCYTVIFYTYSHIGLWSFPATPGRGLAYWRQPFSFLFGLTYSVRGMTTGKVYSGYVGKINTPITTAASSVWLGWKWTIFLFARIQHQTWRLSRYTE